MDQAVRESTLQRLAGMPRHLADVARRFGADRVLRRPAGGGFSLVEHVWHLADLEAEAYVVRIVRTRTESDPLLPDIDGARLAAERNYQLRELQAGLATFATARQRSLALLQEISPGEWNRSARQEGIGALTLADIPRMMIEHDAAHGVEIDALGAELVIAQL